MFVEDRAEILLLLCLGKVHVKHDILDSAKRAACRM